MPTEDRDYHIDRARIELDRAYRTDNHAAARAHFGLAALHMKCLSDGARPATESHGETLVDRLGAALG